MRKRSRYRPRLVGAPLTSAIVAMFREQIVDCQLRLHYAADGFDAFNSAADIFDIVGTLIVDKRGEFDDASIAIRSGALAMVAAGKRARADSVRLTPDELDQVYRGLNAILSNLGLLRDADIYRREREVLDARRQSREEAHA